jgi:hypothetical protein
VTGWEDIPSDTDRDVSRFAVPGGHLYRVAAVDDYGGEFNVALAFVPRASPAPKCAAQCGLTALAETTKPAKSAAKKPSPKPRKRVLTPRRGAR